VSILIIFFGNLLKIKRNLEVSDSYISPHPLTPSPKGEGEKG